MQHPLIRRCAACRLALYALLALMGLVLAWFAFESHILRAAALTSGRTPQEIVRYLEKRLLGHPKLEFVLVPLLHGVKARVEREPPPGPLPTLGKGQQAQALGDSAPGMSNTITVSDPQEIERALQQAEAGTRILIAPGLYPFGRTLQLGHDGTARAPIVLAAARPGTVWLEFEHTEGILVNRPHWVFENLNIRGACAHHHDCEHAFHVVGRAAFTTIRNNHLSNFNAHIKVNGLDGAWPDHGKVAFNTLTNSKPRETTRSVVPFDLVGAHHWQVSDNLVSNFVKRDGNRVSFGLFMKGGSEGGRFERNLVVCTPEGISRPGVRVGISFGGGGTIPEACRQGNCDAFEHRSGLAANNIVAHCNDTALDVNRSTRITLAHNTLINTSGIASRNAPADVHLHANMYEGVALSRDGSSLVASADITEPLSRFFVNADGLLFDWKRKPDPIRSGSFVTNDFSGLLRRENTLPGAITTPFDSANE